MDLGYDCRFLECYVGSDVDLTNLVEERTPRNMARIENPDVSTLTI